MIDRYEWTQRTRYVPEEGRDVTWLEAQTDTGVTVRVELRPHPDEPGVPAPIIMVETPDGQTANSSRVEDWPLIETVLPRLEWPGEVWAGVDGPDPEDRRPDQTVQLDLFREAVTRIDDVVVGEEKADEREAAMIAALELICEQTTLSQEAEDERLARFRYEKAMCRTQGAMIAADLAGIGVSQIAEETRFSRVTVYRRITPAGR